MWFNDARWERYGLWFALAVFLGTRALVLLAAYTAPQDRDRPGAPPEWSRVPMMRWDGGHYSRICKSGYPIVDGKLPTGAGSETVAFLPLYPLAARMLTPWLEPEMALVVFTHIASAAAMLFLYLWARKRYNPRAAFWCVLLLSAYPPGMFFSAAYADGLLVLFVALTLWLLQEGRVWPAALVCGLATATRPTGLALAAVFMLWVLQHRPPLAWPRQLGRFAVIGLVSVSGLIAYFGYLWAHYGRPDAFTAVQSQWSTSRPPDYPLLRAVTLEAVIPPAFDPLKYALRGDLDRLRRPERWNKLWNLMILSLAVAGLIRPGPVPRGFHLLAVVVFLEGWLPDPVLGGRLLGIARYQLIALPSFLLLANWMIGRWPAVLRWGWVVAWLGLQCLYVRHFVNWRLVG